MTNKEAKEIFINRAIMPNGFFDGDAWRHAVRKISDMLENGELQELKTGKWITKCQGFPPEPTTMCSECGFDRDFFIYSMCSECGFDRDLFISFRGKIKYCPNCGAKMTESEE